MNLTQQVQNRAFELAAVAEIVGIPKTLAKNWTIGRPLTIEPSIGRANGKGTRNLYGLDDLYRFAFFNELRKMRMSPSALRRVFEIDERHRPRYYILLPSLEWITVRTTHEEITLGSAVSGKELAIEPLKPTDHGIAVFALNVRNLFAKVRTRATRVGGSSVTGHT